VDHFLDNLQPAISDGEITALSVYHVDTEAFNGACTMLCCLQSTLLGDYGGYCFRSKEKMVLGLYATNN